MVGVSQYKILLICFCFVGISSFFLQKQTEAQPIPSMVSSPYHSLGFGNQTSANATSGQVSSFISFINSASIYYRDDTKARLDYISDQMNKTYGKSGYGFSVLQQGDQSYYDWQISTFTNVFASVAPGVDKVYLKNSYMFSLEPAYSSGRVYFQGVGQKGSGIDSSLQTVIKNTIMAAEKENFCYCPGIPEIIVPELRQFDGEYWNVFCSSNNLQLTLNVFAYGEKYIYTKPKNCYYGIYVI